MKFDIELGELEYVMEMGHFIQRSIWNKVDTVLAAMLGWVPWSIGLFFFNYYDIIL